ncbi:MAG TPA: glutathione S-transferase family protein [Kofleriaceae bacterium]|jgi:glutathione S-transferase|nr:glutathione S-transferase family protein [Kofleriaceae bacterium]
MKLYTFASSPNCWKVLAAARELSIAVETIQVDLFKGEAKTPAFLARNPNGRVPVLEDDGFVLWESNAILAYLASRQPIPSLLPVEPRERADVDRWLYWESTMLSPAVWKVGFEKIIKPIRKQAPDEAQIAAGTADFAAAARVLDSALIGNEYVTGKLSIADFAIGPFINLATGACGLRIDPYRQLSAWRDHMNARASVQQTMADAQAAMRG